MKTKIKRYVKAAESQYLKNRWMSLQNLVSWLDNDTIPCCSMSKEDHAELREGLRLMLNKHNQQTKIEF